jgi:hypothetical protein
MSECEHVIEALSQEGLQAFRARFPERGGAGWNLNSQETSA